MNRIIFSAAVVFAGEMFSLSAQQVSWQGPMEVFPSLVEEAPYVPRYQGRDPFVPLGKDQYSNYPARLSDLEYQGLLFVEGVPRALFVLQRDKGVRFVLKYDRLYDGQNHVVDGVVGEITEKEIVLRQGGQELRLPRKKEKAK